jgi:AbrB family looped-hinge helix DNA binding protein
VKKQLATVTVLSRNRITIPKAIRDRLDSRPGDKFDAREDGAGGWILAPLHGRQIERK